jgi:F0F1-type ATP synthase assembly protein I
MVPDSSNRKDLGRYLGMGQVGMEMVVPIGLGLLLDHYMAWATPWGVIVGAVLGLILGLVRLVRLANQDQPGDPPPGNKPEAR